MTPEDRCRCRRSPVGGPHTWLRSVSLGGRAHGAAVLADRAVMADAALLDHGRA